MTRKHLFSLLLAIASFIYVGAQPIFPAVAVGDRGKGGVSINKETIHASNPMIDPEGRLLVTVTTSDEAPNSKQVFIYRFRRGYTDGGFAMRGILQLGRVNGDTGYSIRRGGNFDLQPNQNIVAATILLDRTYKLPCKVVVERYLADGSPDYSFGTNGFTESILGGNTAYDIADIKVKPDGKILVAANLIDTPANTTTSALLQLMPDGQPDAGFGEGGKRLAVAPYEQYISQLIVLPDNRFITANTYKEGDNQSGICEVIHNADGSVDKHVGTSGVIANGFSSQSTKPDIAMQGNKLIVYTTLQTNNELETVLLRYNPTGEPDANFGNNGKLTVATSTLAQASFPHRVEVQDVGKIFINDADGHKLLRLNPDGRRDSSFGENGVLQDTVPDSYLDFALNHYLLYVLGTTEATGNFFPKLLLNAYRFCYTCEVPKTSEKMITERKTSTDVSSTGVLVFPNPVQSRLMVKGLPAGSTTHLQLTDANGRVMKKATTQNASISWNVASLARGVYYVSIVDDNRKSIRLKVVKE